MNKTLALAALLAAVSFAAPQVIAGETTDPAKSTGAASDQKPGTETSDRTPEKTTPTPDTQVDKSMTGETSDRTPNEATGPAKKMTTESKEPAGAASEQTPGTETSDRTPEKTTPTPETQVDKSKEGETSDRTPEKK